MLKVAISKEAHRTLTALPRSTAERIGAKIRQYAADPASLARNVRRLRGSRVLRLRVGNWRVIFTVEHGQMNVTRVAPRDSAYD